MRHFFAAGYDIRSPAGYRATMAECGRRLGFGRVLAFHLNDAKQPLGSGSIVTRRSDAVTWA